MHIRSLKNQKSKQLPTQALVLGLAGLMMAGTTACTKQSKGAQKDHGNLPSSPIIEGTVTTPATEPTSWSLQWKTHCDAESTHCLGTDGFTFMEDGNWSIGPAGNGDIYRGELEIAERDALRVAVASVIETNANAGVGGLNCVSLAENGIQILSNSPHAGALEIEGSGHRTVLTLEGDQLCGVQDENQNRAMAEMILNLVGKYHPAVFPDECLRLSQDVESAYKPLLQCQRDADCSWIDSTYHPIGEDEVQFVTTDSCTKLRPLVAANRSLMDEFTIERLQGAQNKLVETCGSSLMRIDCAGIAGFESTLAKPVCDLGRCRMPAVEASIYHSFRN